MQKSEPILFVLKQQNNIHWVILNEKGTPISGPRIFYGLDEAKRWASSYISSWPGRLFLIVKLENGVEIHE